MGACIVLGVASLAIALLFRSTAFAPTSPAPTDVVVTINTANKFQQVLAASGTARRMLRIGNNNTNDDICWVFVGKWPSLQRRQLSYSTRQGISSLPAVCAVGRDPSNLRADTLDLEYQ
jgi:hypothetical protein